MNSLTVLLLGVVITLAAAQTCTRINYLTTVGAKCDATNACVSELYCDSVSGTCKFPILPGAACSANADCAANTNYNMICQSSKCTIRHKNGGDTCTTAAECASNSCTSGKCDTLAAGASCATNGLCGSPTNALFCNSTTNGFCFATAASGAACGVTNGVFIQCQPGLYCVNSASTATSGTTTGTCQAPAAENAACSTFPFNSIWSASGCTGEAGKLLTCRDSKCQGPNVVSVGTACGGANGAVCDSANAFCNNGTCTSYGSVSCQSNLNCGSNGICNCPDTTKAGTCAVSPYYSNACTGQAARYAACAATVNTQNALNTCGDRLKATRCCGRNQGFYQSNSDLTLGYCSSATFTQVSFVVMAVVAVVFML